jgi:hypothetical protein
MAELGAIRAAVCALFDDVPDLSTYPYQPASVPNLPALIVVPTDASFATPMQAGRGQDMYGFSLTALVAFGDAAVAQDALDELISESGLIRSRIAANPHLGLGNRTTAWVDGMSAYGITVGDQQEMQNLGATLRLTVRTTG